VSLSLEQLPEPARTAWTRLRDGLVGTLGDDLIAVWAYGGTVATEGPSRSADLEPYARWRAETLKLIANLIDEAEDLPYGG
jgi:hypothetical protein